MARQDNTDFLTAFAIGTALGVGATLLLRPEKPNPRRQLARRLKPHAKKLRKSVEKGRATARTSVRRYETEMTDEVIAAGRELLGEFRAEVHRILDEAREELRALHDEREGRGAAPADGALD